MAVLEDIYYNISIDETFENVKKELGKLHIDFDEYDNYIETERLDRGFNTSCKAVTFDFKNNKLIDINKFY
jgi:hypothetical protein